MERKEWRVGFRHGFPIAMGYFSISFGFGTMAAAKGMNTWIATLMSVTNLTSAGQFAGLTQILSGAMLWEIILTQLVINSRYALMSVALSQRMGQKVGVIPRMCIAFFNTDEIFAMAMSRQEPLTVPYMFGLGLLPIWGWILGTLLGGLAGSILPASVRTALGVVLYGMFVAILVPPAKKDRSIFMAILLAVVFSCLLTWVPLFRKVSGGVSILIVTVAVSAICALLFPEKEDGE